VTLRNAPCNNKDNNFCIKFVNYQDCVYYVVINFVEQSISKIRFINFKQNTCSLMRFEVQGDEDSYCRILGYDTV